MVRFFHQVLLKLPPETAHDIAISTLKTRQKLGKLAIPKSASIHIKSLAKLEFRSRVGMAAGFDKNAEIFPALGRLGFGFVEVGTVTPKPQEGNPKPRIFRLRSQKALVNQLGFNNVGIHTFVNNVKRNRKLFPELPLFANIGKGKSTPEEGAQADYAYSAGLLEEHVDGFVVNLSSPNTPGLRNLQTESFLENLAAVLPKSRPVFVKLAPDLDNTTLTVLAEQIESSSFYSGLVLTNTSKALALELGEKTSGGLSGAPLFERSLECVSIARSRLKSKVLIGVGGISSVAQAERMRRVGANLIEVYTAFIYQGPDFIRELTSID